MDEFHLNSLGQLLIFSGVFAECCSFLCYQRAKSRLKSLNGTGRMNDIGIAYNRQQFFRVAMVAVPVLLYVLMSALLPS